MTEENEEQVILLKDENGEEHKFHVIDFLTENESKYVVLQPIISSEEDDIEKEENMENETEEETEAYEAVIMRVEEENEEHVLVLVEDDDEWERVAKAFEEKQQS